MPYATAAELKAELQPDDSTFARDDALYASLVQEASDAIDKYCRRSFVVPGAVSVRTYSVDSRGKIIGLDDIASTSGLAIETDAGGTGTFTALDASSWFADVENGTGRVLAIYSTGKFPSSQVGRRTVRITARFGWPSVPSPVHRACLLWARRLYVRKDSPAGVLGFIS